MHYGPARQSLRMAARTFLALALLATLPACDDPPVTEVPAVVAREAPDVPWSSVAISSEVEGPEAAAKVLADCFDGSETLAEPPAVDYLDNEPDGDDQQAAQLCVSWSAHLDRADCVRRALIAGGGAVEVLAP